MYNFKLNVKGSSFVELLNKCDKSNGVLVFKPKGTKAVQLINRRTYKILNIIQTSTTLVYSTEDKGELSFQEYVYISLIYNIQNLAYKVNKLDDIDFSILSYIGELTSYVNEIQDVYDFSIQKILEKM